MKRITLNMSEADLANIRVLTALPRIKNRTHAVATALATAAFLADALRDPAVEFLLRSHGDVTSRIILDALRSQHDGAAAEKEG